MGGIKIFTFDQSITAISWNFDFRPRHGNSLDQSREGLYDALQIRLHRLFKGCFKFSPERNNRLRGKDESFWNHAQGYVTPILTRTSRFRFSTALHENHYLIVH